MQRDVTAYDRVLEALRKTVPSVKANERQATANCPAHDDQHPSLGVTRIEGSVLICCRSQGCHIDDILTALKLIRSDLYDDPAGVTYRYDDGRMVHRTPDKKFRQSGTRNKVAQLYRLSNIRAAVAEGKPVYVVEGEKDVHALEAVGAVATTSPQGSSNWHKADASPLQGAHVIIVPDRDDAGRRYAMAVTSSLKPLAASLRLELPAEGCKDAADHIAAGHGLSGFVHTELPVNGAAHDDDEPALRRIRLTPASQIPIRPVRWLWDGRLPLGSLALLAGREGIGKSSVAYQLAGEITRGVLPGCYYRNPRSVIVAATEDSWEHTIVPRLMAAGADLERVFRVDVEKFDGSLTSLILPRDLGEVENAVKDTSAALILLDPLMSRLDEKLDTHKDAEVRVALEPLTRTADNCGAAVLGLIHVNKTSSTEPLTTIMGSRAFAAVARAVLYAMVDPEDDGLRLLGQPKNNLGRSDLPSLTFRIESTHVADTDEGPVWTGRVRWNGETERTLADALETAGDGPASRSAVAEAADWLEDHLASRGGEDEAQAIKAAARKDGHTEPTLQRARQRLKVGYTRQGYPSRTYWSLPGSVISSPGESEITEMTDTTDMSGPQSSQSSQSFQLCQTPRARETTDDVDCLRCGNPMDSAGHEINCEGAP